MTISDLCIKRPVFTWVLVAIPVVMGVVAYGGLGVDLFPDVDFPVCTVTTTLPGASVEEMETSVTKPIEDIINTVSGIDELRSTTSEGISVVTVQFQLSKNGNVGTQEVRDKINTILVDLPDGTDPPIVEKFDTGSMPVMTIAVSGRRDFREVTELARRRIKERLETVNGVGAITLAGGRVRAMNVVVDANRLAAYALSVEDVRMALVRENLEVPGGRVDQGPRELVLRTLGRLSSPKEFNAMIVANRNGHPVRLSDIGRAEDSYEEPRTYARLDGEDAVSLVIQKQSGANTVKVVNDLLDRLKELKAGLPPDIETVIIRDQSRFIRKSIEEVQFHLLLAAGLVSATILLFIRDWRTTLIATLAIPTSIIPTFLFMQYMGFTLNNITMLGLILAIGIVIDDAVVVHENIFRHMEEDGMDAMEAARVGTKEIALAVLATSLSLVVIFMPIAFMGGIVGRFFSSFGLTVAFAVMMSLFVSFTLTPMLCSRFLKLEPGEAGHAKSKSGFIYRLVDGSYGGMLRGALRFKSIVVVVALLVTMAPAFSLIGGMLEKKIELNLMSWGDGSKVPTAGNNLVVVGTDNDGRLHIRIFDASGGMLTDTDETKLPSSQAVAISTLKQQLPGLLPPLVLTDAGKSKIITEATSIAGQPLNRLQRLSQALKVAGAPFAPGFNLIPRDDQSEYEVRIRTPEGYSLDRTSKLFAEIETRLRNLPGTVHIFTTIGQTSGGRVIKGEGDVTNGTIYVRMTELGDRKYTQFAIQQEARDFLTEYPDLRVSVNDVSAFQGGARPQTFQINLSGPKLEVLDELAQKLMSRLKEKPGLVDLDTSLSLRKPEVQVVVDREAASDLGIPVQVVADTLRVLVGGMPVSKFRDGAEQYDVWLRARRDERSSTRDLNDLTLPSSRAGLVKLTSLAKLKEARGPTEIERLRRERIVTVLGNPESIPLGEAVNRAQAIIAEMNLPPQYSYVLSGQAKTMAETGYYFVIAFALSVIFMFLILAAQFESWMQPVAILMALPVTVPFGLLSLVLFHSPMDLYAMFGLFMLVGIVKKNGILQVDATNQLRARGLPRREAILEANATRLRPILMTTVMLIAAMVPIALGQGPGAGSRASMAKVIIGGQALSLVLALLVTPVFYVLLDMWVNFTRRLGIRFAVEPQTTRVEPARQYIMHDQVEAEERSESLV
jgi:multidrug efflux pump subunit AcrB